MRNINATSLFSTWVKNVYSLCIGGVVTSANPYTGSLVKSFKTYQLGVQPLVFTKTMNRFKPALYTVNYSNFNLLDRRLYTVSTAPTNEKTKKYMKGNY